MSRVIVLAAAAALLVAAPAAAAAPVPGALYEGTTDSGSPFSFKVAPDGASVTEITTSAPLTCVGPEGGVEVFALVSKTPIPVAGGGFAGNDDEAMPRLEVNGTFSSATEATGTVIARTSKFSSTQGLTTCMRELTFTARTAQGGAETATSPDIPALSIEVGGRPKLGTVLRKGMVLAGLAPESGRLVVTARLTRRDARRYGTGRVLARLAGNVPGGPFGLRLKPKKRTARLLADARRLKVTITVAGPDGAGARTRRSSTITLER